jgi:hypothetical protein
LTPRAEGALRHFLQDIVAADGFDDFFLGLFAFVLVIVVLLVALRGGGMVVVLRSGGIAIHVFGLRRVVGMGSIFERVLLMGMNVMRVIFARFRIGRRIRCGCGGCLDGCRNRHIGLGFWRYGFVRGMTVVVLIGGVLMRMVRIVMNMLV